MKKTAWMVAVITGLALGASAGSVEYWEFNEAAGVDLNDAVLVNSGSLGSVWNFNTPGMLTDGAGDFVIAGDGGTTTRKLPKKGTANANLLTDDYATPLAGSDTYTLEMNISSFDLTAATVGDAVNLKAMDSTGTLVALINVEKDSATTSRIRFASANSNYRNHAYTLSEGAHTAKVEFNLAAGTSEYFIDGVSKNTFSGQTFAGNIGGLIFVKAGSWTTAASSVSVDSMGLSVASGGNSAPTFDSDPVVAPGAATNAAYSGTLADYASDADGDPMVFEKLGGPDWLDVATNGALTGTTPATTGLNSWTVQVADNHGGTNTATLEISVTTLQTPYTGTNVLFIAIDDINPILGSFGNTLIQTPNMDRLATRGMLFENAHCQWSVCGPSRASLMTGLMPEQTGVMGFVKMRGISADGLRDNPSGLTNLITIPQHFKNNGYETAAIGKINDNRCVGSINPDGTINEDGGTVDDPPSWSIGFSNPSGVGSTRAVRVSDGVSVALAAESVDDLAANFTDGKIATEGLVRLNTMAVGDKPFFLGVGFKKPHLPFLAPKSSWDLYAHDDFTPHPFQTDMLNVTTYTFNSITELRNSYYLEVDGDGKALQITPDVLPDDQQKTLLHGYYACISHVDEQVGRLLDELDALGLASNTIVVLWGDHGFHLGDHNEWGKHTNLEQATRVPFIISAPGFPAGGKTAAPVGLLDIYPTLCELANLSIPEQPLSETESTGRPLAGRSLVPILSDPDARVQTGIMNHYASGTYGYAYRTERYRYTEWVDSSGIVQAQELYDYETDPMETVNLAVYPEFDALMYQYSRSMRSTSEAGGCDRLKSSPAMAEPANKILPALDGIVGGTDVELVWPDAAESTYNILQKTNLLDAAWSTIQSDVSGSPHTVPADQRQSFYRIEVGN